MWSLATKVSRVIPMHYGSIVGGDQDAVKFKEALGEKYEVILLDKR